MQKGLPITILISLCAAALASCSHTIEIQSTPSGAEIYVISEKGDRERKLGVTPLGINLTDTSLVSIEKKGYQPLHLIVPRAGLLSRSQVTLQLESLESDAFLDRILQNKPSLLNNSLQKLLELQASIASHRVDQVKYWLSQNEKNYAQLAVFHALIGNFYFLEGQIDDAKNHYAAALDLEPGHAEAFSMMQLIEKKSGRQP